jgi:hypothetical protein
MLERARELAVGGLLVLGGELGLPAVAAAARRAALHLGNDTGVSHLAAAVGTPTVVVFGPSDERRFRPFGRRPDGSPLGLAVAAPPLAADDPSPAFLGRATASVSVEAVLAAVDRQLAPLPQAPTSEHDRPAPPLDAGRQAGRSQERRPGDGGTAAPPPRPGAAAGPEGPAG